MGSFTLAFFYLLVFWVKSSMLLFALLFASSLNRGSASASIVDLRFETWTSFQSHLAADDGANVALLFSESDASLGADSFAKCAASWAAASDGRLLFASGALASYAAGGFESLSVSFNAPANATSAFLLLRGGAMDHEVLKVPSAALASASQLKEWLRDPPFDGPRLGFCFNPFDWCFYARSRLRISATVMLSIAAMISITILWIGGQWCGCISTSKQKVINRLRKSAPAIHERVALLPPPLPKEELAKEIARIRSAQLDTIRGPDAQLRPDRQRPQLRQWNGGVASAAASPLLELSPKAAVALLLRARCPFWADPARPDLLLAEAFAAKVVPVLDVLGGASSSKEGAANALATCLAFCLLRRLVEQWANAGCPGFQRRGAEGGGAIASVACLRVDGVPIADFLRARFPDPLAIEQDAAATASAGIVDAKRAARLTPLGAMQAVATKGVAFAPLSAPPASVSGPLRLAAVGFSAALIHPLTAEAFAEAFSLGWPLLVEMNLAQEAFPLDVSGAVDDGVEVGDVPGRLVRSPDMDEASEEFMGRQCLVMLPGDAGGAQYPPLVNCWGAGWCSSGATHLNQTLVSETKETACSFSALLHPFVSAQVWSVQCSSGILGDTAYVVTYEAGGGAAQDDATDGAPGGANAALKAAAPVLVSQIFRRRPATDATASIGLSARKAAAGGKAAVEAENGAGKSE